jgi:hypothetical protein
MDVVSDSEQREKLDGLFQNARLYQTNFKSNGYTAPIHTEIKSTQAAINALRSPPLLVGGTRADVNLISVSTTRNTFFAVRQTFMTTFSFALPSHVPLTDGSLSVDEERVMLETPTCSESYVFLLLTELDKSWQGCIVHDTGDYTLETAFPSMQDTQYIKGLIHRPNHTHYFD